LILIFISRHWADIAIIFFRFRFSIIISISSPLS
jgi:hypothetical protein